jgi:hypothetical protein
MPYIDWEEIRMHDIRKNYFDKMTHVQFPNYADWANLPMGAKLLISYFWETSPIHDRRTLDQAFYYTAPLKDIWERDTDQVLFRYLRDEGKPEGSRRILMVDQLWIWIIDAPEKLNSRGPSKSTLHTFF